MARLLLVTTAGIVDAGAAIVLSGKLWCGLVVLVAGGWAAAQHDDGYQPR
jgi:hypothetical protein